MTRTAASEKLKKFPGNLTDLAAKLGVSPSTLDRCLRGGAPSPGIRKRIEERGGPKREEWDVLLPDDAPRDPPPRDLELLEPETASPEATRRLADKLHADAQRLQVRVSAMVSSGEDVKKALDALQSLSRVVTELGKLTGAAILNERQILMSPAWLQLETVIIDALEPWPDAMQAVAAALQEMRATK